MADLTVGIVRELRRYPVKSMAAEPLSSASVSWHGVEGDRRWAFIRPGMERSGFPWLTIREVPELWRYQPQLLNPQEPDRSTITVKTPDGDELDIADPALAQRLGDGVRLIRQSGGIFDTFPLSLLSIQSVEGLSEDVGESLTPLRFRPNIVIDASDGGGFPEDKWVDATLRIGSMRCRVTVRDPRCVMVNVDPEGLAQNPAVLRAIAKKRDACFGVYGSVIEPGEVRIGDEVSIQT